jgi:hypothetical protein
MTKNGIFLSVVAVLLAALYIYFFTDWFHKKTIQIIPTIRPTQPSAIPRDPDQPPVYPVSFALDGKYELTSVKVVAAADMATNRYPAPLWHLTSDSNSAPTRSIVYGSNIKGMKPAVTRQRPEPLMPEVEYVLLVEAGDLKAKTNFHTARALVRGQ